MSTTVTVAGTGGTDGDPNYVVVGLAVGIPCGAVILLLIILISVMLLITTCKTNNAEEMESMYARRRFQGLSLEEQRKQQKNKRGKFKRRRGSAATTASRHSTIPSSIQLDPQSNKSRVRKENPFQLQKWQLKLSGIGVSRENEILQDGDGDSPIGAVNPLLIKDENDEPDYEPARSTTTTKKVNIVEQQPSKKSQLRPVPASDDLESNSSDSFNPYD